MAGIGIGTRPSERPQKNGRPSCRTRGPLRLRARFPPRRSLPTIARRSHSVSRRPLSPPREFSGEGRLLPGCPGVPQCPRRTIRGHFIVLDSLRRADRGQIPEHLGSVLAEDFFAFLNDCPSCPHTVSPWRQCPEVRIPAPDAVRGPSSLRDAPPGLAADLPKKLPWPS